MMDTYYAVGVGVWIKEEMYVKPSDLGPYYRPPFKALAYVMHDAGMVPDWGRANEGQVIGAAETIYMHNKL